MSRARNLLLTTTALVPLLAAAAVAGPQGPSVVGGSATVQNPGTANVVVNQTSQRAIINWHMFNIGAGETTTFNTPGASAVTLNRVTGGMGPSQILGTLNSNGQVFIVNRDGFVFGAGAVVNTAGFLATTHDIKNEDFMNGDGKKWAFTVPGRADASIVNLGTITAHSGGFAALVAPGVRNAGTITATLGTVGLASSGNGFSLDLYGDKLITLGVNDQVASKVIDVATGQPLNSLVTNTGKLSANGGRVELTAAAARHVVDSVINTSGVIEANSIGTKGGQIILGAATGASKPAGAPKQTVKVSGKLSVTGKQSGEKGGKVQITGENIVVAGATIDASGAAGGGKVLIGGDWGGGHATVPVNNASAQLESDAIPTATWLSVDSATTIDASATESGNGGKVILWADERTSFAGRILALGGPVLGDGGFAEVSGHNTLDFAGASDLSAANGTRGTLLLDPTDYTIWNGVGPAPTGSSMLTSTLESLLAAQNVIITTNDSGGDLGDIRVASSFSWSTSTTLSLIAHNNIYFNYGVTVANTGAGNLILRGDSLGTGIPGTGRIILLGGTNINWSGSTGKVDIFYNPVGGYTNPTFWTTGSNTGMNGYGGNVVVGPSSQLTAYMLVNSVGDLINIGTNEQTLGGTYALGRDIDGSTYTNTSGTFAPISGWFNGMLDGLGHTISNLNIAATGFATNTGLFSAIGGDGLVRNLKLSGITVTGHSVIEGNNYLGLLAGWNSGVIENVDVSGTVQNGAATHGIVAGGLVGYNEGAISGSDAVVTVTSTAGGTIGGLVGINGGAITNSTASGSVTGSGGSLASFEDTDVYESIPSLGGLVGLNYGSIHGSKAFATVTGNGFLIGGLVGLNASSIYISEAHGLVNGTQALAGGFVGANFGSIESSKAFGSVTVGNQVLENDIALAGGFVGENLGSIYTSSAHGIVTGGNAAFLGGFAGLNVGQISVSHSTSAVTGGSGSFVGGFVAENIGAITKSFATGAVKGLADSWVGGFAALNFQTDSEIGVGTLQQVYSTGAVTGGSNSTVAGLVAVNLGWVDQAYASGFVTGGAGSTTGGLVAVNSYNLPPEYDYGSTSGVVTYSYWDTQRTGQSTSAAGVGLTTAALTGSLPSGFDPYAWSITPGTSYPYLTNQPNPIPTPHDPPPHDPPPHNPPPASSGDGGHTLPPLPEQLSTPQEPQQQQDVVSIVNTVPPPAPPNTGNPQPPPRRLSGVPPRGETRFVNNEVVLQLAGNVSPEQLAAVARELGLEVIASENVGLLARTVYRFRITNGKSVSDVIRALEAKNITAFAQPNYVYTLTQAPETSAQETASISHTHGDSEQYVISKLRLQETHAVARGSNVLVAVIDSAVDPNHPDLKDAIAETLNAIEGEVKPHTHGTGMAGAIASQRRLLGVAPRSRLLTISAFGPKAQTAESTSMQIVKGLNWAVEKGAKVINMSFAGPHDPILAQAFKTMHDRGIVMIAAAGNAGPGSPPLFPAADPNVIAVTATDIQDKVFTRANRGKHIAIAAPGVDVLVPAPEGSYQLTTGTSVAAAHISGVAALLLERNPTLKPGDIRKLLTGTARKSVGTRPEEIGSGLVDPYQALQRSGRSAATQ